VRIARTDDSVTVEVDDNGIGLPSDLRDRLVEPYVTTRSKGTGLGLAIVKKIMEDHGGELTLEDGIDGGARVRLIFETGAREAATSASASIPRTVASHGA
jgi:two-component system nitrogen regulation sensor histidine kinase NtrY